MDRERAELLERAELDIVDLVEQGEVLDGGEVLHPAGLDLIALKLLDGGRQVLHHFLHIEHVPESQRAKELQSLEFLRLEGARVVQVQRELFKPSREIHDDESPLLSDFQLAPVHLQFIQKRHILQIQESDYLQHMAINGLHTNLEYSQVLQTH